MYQFEFTININQIHKFKYPKNIFLIIIKTNLLNPLVLIKFCACEIDAPLLMEHYVYIH